MCSTPRPNEDGPAPPALDTTEVEIDARRVAWTLFLVWLGIEVALVLLDGFVNYARLADSKSLRRLCNIAREDGLATWFSATQALLVSGVLWLVRAKAGRSPGAKRDRLGWTVLAVSFAYLAIDDGAGIHERLGSTFSQAVERSGEGGPGAWLLQVFPSYPWQILLGPPLGALALYMVVFLARRLRDRGTRLLVAAALGCYAAAVGLDFVEGLAGGQDRLVEALDVRPYTVRHWLKALEEFLEMLGTTCFLTGFFRHLGELPGHLRLRV